MVSKNIYLHEYQSFSPYFNLLMLKIHSKYLSRTLWKLISSLLLLLICISASAQSGSRAIKHLSTKDGLSSNEVRKVLQDSYGFIWFATSDGLCRWDGYEFKVFKNYTKESNSLPNYFLLCLEEDTSKNIWIGTNHGGLARYNTQEDRFYRYVSSKEDENSIPGMVVRCVFKDSRQNIWIGSHSGLARYNPESDNFTRFSISGDNSEVSTDIRQIFQITSNELIIQSDAGFFTLNTESNLIKRFELPGSGIDKKVFLQNNPACFDSKGFLWIGSPEGLYSLDVKSGTSKKYLPDAKNSKSINSSNFSVIFEDSRSTIWVGTENRGLNMYNRETDDFTHFEAGLSKNNISNNIISDIYEDKHSTIWISTLEGGVNYFSYRQPMFEHFFHDPFDKNSLSGNRVAAFCEDDSGFIWIGTEDGGLNKYSAKNDSFTRYRLNSEFIAPSILSIEKHAQNQFYIAGLRVGLYNFNSTTAQFSNLMKTSKESEIMLFDADKLEKILSNLLSNALKFTPEGGEVTLAIKKVNSFLEIRVIDTGIGIPESDLSKIFDRFYTVARKGEKKFEGTGIGLTLVKEFTELHKGVVEVKSKESKGTEFIVRIPVIRKDKVSETSGIVEFNQVKSEISDYHSINTDEAEAKQTKTSGKKRRVLLVEDDKELRKFLRNELIDDYEVFESADGMEGWESTLLNNPHLIVSDIMMPRLSGVELCRKIKSDDRTSHIPVVLLTAMHSQENQIEGLETGADDYIFKPFNVAVIKSRITNLLNSREKLSKIFNESQSLDFEHKNHNDRDNKLIQSVIDIVLENITNEKINADFVAGKLHISRSLLYIKIEAITGESVNEFVRNIRLKKSTSLIRNKNISISEVAFAVGFSSQSYFTRCFTRKYGKSPREMQDEQGS